MILKQKQWPILVTAFLCMTFANVTAQAKKLQDSTPEQRAKMMTEWMTNKLALNTKQVEQVSALNLQYAKKNDPILQSNEGKLAKFKKLKALQKEKSNALSQILDAGQYKKYEEIKDQMVQTLKEKKKMKKLFYPWVMILFITASACSQSTNDADEAALIQPKLGNSFQGPIQKPASGYGADGNYEVAEIDFSNPQYTGTQVSIFYPKGITSPRPTIFFSHPFGGEDKEYNIELYNFIAKKGYVVVFVPYRTIDISVDHRYQTLWEGFIKAAADYPNIIDTQKVGFMGHSFGGGASIDLAYKAFTEKGWGQNGRFLFTMAPWYSFNWNSTLTTQQQLQSFPSNTKMITQVYDEDDVNDHRMAIDIFKNINISNAEKDFVYIKSSTVNGYNYVTDHAMPSSRKVFDALDYYGVYRLLDAMMDYSFNGNATAKNVALGNGSAAQITMPSYSGQSMTPLEVTDNPTPKYPQGKYQFQCGDSTNPRISYCN